MSKILIACGGTGGHLAPGIAIAEALQDGGHDCVLLVSEKEIDSVLIEKYERLRFYRIQGRAFSGGFKSTVASIGGLISSYMNARNLLREQEPDVVLLFGGFLSVGLGLAAHVARIPIVLHEANCKPGRATRLLKHFAMRVYLPDGVKLNGVGPGRSRYYGYPVRKEIRHVLKSEACQRLGIEARNKLLVVIGGSQGAEALNQWVIENFEALANAGISVYCVTGPGKISERTIQFENEKRETISATFIQFSDQMGDVLSAADIIVSRAGAGAIAEIICCRAPSILIPYPYAADDHQQANALMHEKHGAGMVLPEDNLNRLSTEVKRLVFNDELLRRLKFNLEHLERLDSGKRIVEDLEQICVEHSPKDQSLSA